ncbi:MAG: threonine ammonia-lyase [Campylobacterales bacterium]|nr:threonine ammonia-lyase [Campylobacterales bacterium]
MVNLQNIKEAKERVKEVIAPVPFVKSEFLSQSVDAQVFIKKCNLQNTGAFKIRGAFNKISMLTDDEKKAGVIAASAGNHAQGVAFSAKHFGIKAVIVMPEATPLLKVNGVKSHGAEVVLKGNNYDEAYAYAKELGAKNKMTFVHPFEDDEVIAGQGTIGLEMLKAEPDLDIVLVPVGGGGLISGIATAVKSINPKIRVVGVSAKGAPAMFESFAAKNPIDSTSVKTIADGIAVRDTSPKMLDILTKYVDEMVQVDDEEIANAILFLMERHKIVVEGAGAVGVAALMHDKLTLKKGEKVGVVLSGGNIDVNTLSLIIEKGLAKSHRKMKLIITLIDKPGSLMELTGIFKNTAANIVAIDYDRTASDLAYGDANIIITLESKGKEHQEAIKEALKAKKFKFSEVL